MKVMFDFTARQTEAPDRVASLSPDAQAALAVYPLERTMGYGVNYSDAVELRARVLQGESWQSAAETMAEICQARAATAGTVTQVAYLRRASALVRMAQAMMMEDTDERRTIFARAADLYAQAAELAGDCERVLINTTDKPLAGWMFPAVNEPVAAVIVIGGTEGWAMDFDCLGHALATRGIHALMLDAPGQGETRFTHGHTLSADWRSAFSSAVDYLEDRAKGLPLGIIGNSMGGSLAMAYAAGDPRIRACCNNGGPFAPWMAPTESPYFAKIMAFCGVETAAEATEVLKSVTPMEAGINADYPLLFLHGAEDHLISNPVAQMLYDGTPTEDIRMVTFSDGDHCLYRHRDDRDFLIADWTRARLVGRD
tara:strand:- start:90275 stop:91381 length:1107 start_codon:yes stop_codon:yes gene_type:complete